MPRYEYKCQDCDGEFLIQHSVGEKIDTCPQCDSVDTLQRIYSFSIERDKVPNKNKPGTLVKSHIEEAKEELRKEKASFSSKEFSK